MAQRRKCFTVEYQDVDGYEHYADVCLNADDLRHIDPTTSGGFSDDAELEDIIHEHVVDAWEGLRPEVADADIFIQPIRDWILYPARYGTGAQHRKCFSLDIHDDDGGSHNLDYCLNRKDVPQHLVHGPVIPPGSSKKTEHRIWKQFDVLVEQALTPSLDKAIEKQWSAMPPEQVDQDYGSGIEEIKEWMIRDQLGTLDTTPGPKKKKVAKVRRFGGAIAGKGGGLLKKKRAENEGERMVDFFFPKKDEPEGSGFFGLDSFERRRRR